jgi:hypothetical protein
MDKIDKKLKLMYDKRNEMSKEGRKSCPYCKSRSWWQTGRAKQCNKCYQLF